jgi:hypothetical protein
MGAEYNKGDVCRVQYGRCVQSTIWEMCVEYNMGDVCRVQYGRCVQSTIREICAEYNMSAGRPPATAAS